MAINWGGLLDPTTREGMAAAGLFGGLQNMGSALMQMGQLRPVGQPAPTFADAFGAFGQGQQQGYARAKAQRDAMGMAAWDEAFSPNADPTKLSVTAAALRNSVPENMRAVFGALPTDMRAQVMGQLLTRKTNPKDNIQVVGNNIYDVSSGKPVLVTTAPDTHSAERLAQDIMIRQAGRPNVSVSLERGPQFGTIQPGYMMRKNPDGSYEQVPVKGSPAEVAQTEGNQKSYDAATQTLAVIDSILNDPALPLGTGASGQALSRIPGTPVYDFSQKVAQLQGRAFLEAFNTLKGGGQITEVEGKKATDAIARLSTAQSEKAFKEALGELRAIASTAQQRAQRKLPQGGVPIPGAAPGVAAEPPPAGGSAPTMRWNPATMRVEPVR